MTDTNVQDSQLVGKEVLHVDSSKNVHHGVIVAVDDEWLYVLASDTKTPPAEWHFKIRKELYPVVRFPRS